MAGSRISLVLHDGIRVRDRRPLRKDFHDKTVLETTRSIYGSAMEIKSYEGLGEEVVAIGDLRKDDKAQAGLQLYLAIEVDGRVIEMGLPFLASACEGEKFLNPANIRPGDIDALLKNMPSNAEVLLVWRLDRGMTQDIMMSGNSIVSSMAPPQGNDYSLLDQKPCISCGMGAGSKIDLVADISEVRIFCGDRDNPIRMSTLVVSPPESFSFDSWTPQAPVPSPFIQIRQPLSDIPGSNASKTQNPLVMHADFLVRMSWEDSLKGSEIALPLSFQMGPYPEESSRRLEQDMAKENRPPNPTPVAFVFAICPFETPSSQIEAPVVPAQTGAKQNLLLNLILNPAELRLWGRIYGRPVQNEAQFGAAQAPPASAPLPAPTMASMMGAISQPNSPTSVADGIPKPKTFQFQAFPQSATSSITTNLAFYGLQQETILKSFPNPVISPHCRVRPQPRVRPLPVLAHAAKKKKAQPKRPTPEKLKSREKPKPKRGMGSKRKRSKSPALAVQPHGAKQGRRNGLPATHSKLPLQKAATPKTPKALVENCNRHKIKRHNSAMVVSMANVPMAAGKPNNPARPQNTLAPVVSAKKIRTSALKKDARARLLNDLLGLYRNSRGRKFRMKKNRVV